MWVFTVLFLHLFCRSEISHIKSQGRKKAADTPRSHPMHLICSGNPSHPTLAKHGWVGYWWEGKTGGPCVGGQIQLKVRFLYLWRGGQTPIPSSSTKLPESQLQADWNTPYKKIWLAQEKGPKRDPWWNSPSGSPSREAHEPRASSLSATHMADRPEPPTFKWKTETIEENNTGGTSMERWKVKQNMPLISSKWDYIVPIKKKKRHY